ncbi:MAG TPA: citrate/2-methylcitrate synthase [Phycisphaerales bacterium]|nr:citrate/2-methylcitrate synthase [Phycisphaerales bacterium]HMP38492.1 citrate/2-methylcitrate synthase [Phycisphaerales bacterium]
MTTSTTGKAPDTRGLAGQTVGETAICAVTQTQLIYRGYEIADLAAHATFEEVAYLLLVGQKPSAAEIARFRDELVAARAIPEPVKRVIREIVAANRDTHPMSVVRTAVSTLSHVDPETEDNSPPAEMRKARRLLAQIPTIIGYHQMTLDGKSPVEPDPSLGHAANLLWCMTGTKPSELHAKVLDVSLILYAEHDFNASTFACRVIASTEADMHSAVCGGIGALKGPLHGGANEMAMEMLKEIERDTRGGSISVEAWMRRAFEEKRKLMGFGHRVYRNGDHRAGILRGWGLKIAEAQGPEAQKWFALGDKVQEIMLREKNIHPNVDFPCGTTYFVMGLPVPQYTPVFVASRVSGWCAHIMEQHANNRIIRPLAEYAGPSLREWAAT